MEEERKRKLELEDGEAAKARIFVGNLPLPQSNRPQEAFAAWFGKMMRERVSDAEKLQFGFPENYVDGVEQWSVDEGICFLRLTREEDIYTALRVCGAVYEGFAISVTLPSLLPERLYSELPLVQKTCPPSPKPFLSKWRGKFVVFSDLPPNTTEGDIRSLFEALGGPVENLQCHREEGIFRGAGRLSLINNLIIDTVVQRLNNAPVGVHVMRMASFLPDNRRLPTLNGASVSFDRVQDEADPMQSVTAQLILADPVIGLQMRANRLLGSKPSRVVLLHNMVKIEDVVGVLVYTLIYYFQLCEELRQELMREIRKEAIKYGRLESLVAPRPIRSGQIACDSGCGKVSIEKCNKNRRLSRQVFLEYADLTSARKAQLEFNGRSFEGRTVCAAFYPLLPYQLRQYSLLVP